MQSPALRFAAASILAAFAIVSSAVSYAEEPAKPPAAAPAPTAPVPPAVAPTPASSPAEAKPAADAKPKADAKPAAEAKPPSAAPEADKGGTEMSAVVIDGTAETLLGKPVLSTKGDDLGRIVDVIVDRDGTIRAAVIDFGGFLGVGSRKIAVDWRELHFPKTGKLDKVIADVPQDQLRISPLYRVGEPVVIVGKVAAAPKAAPVAAPPPTPKAAEPAPVQTKPEPAPAPPPKP